MQNKQQKIIEKRANGSKRVATQFYGESRTQKQFQDQCDVNRIIAKYKKTGSITHVRNAQNGTYADLTNLPDLQQAQEVVIAATKAFEAVPSHIRQRFQHDPNQMIAFLNDPKNDQEAISLGLKIKPSAKEPDPILQELQTLNKNLKPKPKSKNEPE